MNTTHTPGPWRIGDAGRTIFGPPAGPDHAAPVTVADLPPVTPRVNGNERYANAALIAAAPDLLAALVDCLAGMEAALESDDPAASLQSDWDAPPLSTARAAIAKAGGQ